MLKIRLRVRPCRARCSPRSVGRLTRSVESSRSIERSRETACDSSPLGPFTRTSPASIATSTPAGISMGSFPMRLMAGLPDVGEDLAPDTLVAGLIRRHHTARRRQDCCSHAALHARQLIGGRVLTPAGLGHATQAADHRLAGLGVLEPDPQRVELGCALALPGPRRPRGLLDAEVL